MQGNAVTTRPRAGRWSRQTVCAVLAKRRLRARLCDATVSVYITAGFPAGSCAGRQFRYDHSVMLNRTAPPVDRAAEVSRGLQLQSRWWWREPCCSCKL